MVNHLQESFPGPAWFWTRTMTLLGPAPSSLRTPTMLSTQEPARFSQLLIIWRLPEVWRWELESMTPAHSRVQSSSNMRSTVCQESSNILSLILDDSPMTLPSSDWVEESISTTAMWMLLAFLLVMINSASPSGYLKNCLKIVFNIFFWLRQQL